MAPAINSGNPLVEAGAQDSEDDLLTTATLGAGAENRRTTTKAPKSSKSKAMPRSTSTATKRKAPAKTTQSRTALKDRTNLQAGSDTDEADNFEDDDGAKPKPKRVKTSTTAQKPRATKAPATTKSRTTASTRPPAIEPLAVIPETQPDPEQHQDDISQSIEVGEAGNMDVSTVPTPPPVARFVQRARSTSVQPLMPRASARSASAQPGYPPFRERSGSVSATERRGGDPELRRKLNDVTKKYENLNSKYQGLQEIGETGAQSNFEKLKRASDQKAKDADALIASLKKELAEVKKAAANSVKSAADTKETESLQKQLASLTATNNGLTIENGNLKSSLQVAQNEVKSSEARLVAARQQLSNTASAQENSKSAADTNGKASLTRSAAPNATEAQKEAKMKENLYSDLTGLIIRSVKRKEGEDEYDCIQTGRNGTLHFHLSIANDANVPNPRTPSGLSYEDAEFAYEPLLDEGRDRDLLEILPDYLTEEICFPRNHAVKFYTRVVDSMTKKIVVEE